MRVYNDFREAKNEIARDLNELGTRIFAGYQSMDIQEGDAARDLLTTTELQHYDYIVLRPDIHDLEPTQPWADAEWVERLDGLEHVKGHNPGQAWRLREDVWLPLLEETTPVRKFSYTYSERFYAHNALRLVNDMRLHPTTRQCYLSVWDPVIDNEMVGYHRVPCSLGYQLMQRDGALDIAYHMRSSDFATHFDNDLFMALKVQQWFCGHLRVPPGRFVHKIGSLHVYATEVAHVF